MLFIGWIFNTGPTQTTFHKTLFCGNGMQCAYFGSTIHVSLLSQVTYKWNFETSGQHWHTYQLMSLYHCHQRYRRCNTGAMLVHSLVRQHQFQSKDRYVHSINIGPAYECGTCRTLVCTACKIDQINIIDKHCLLWGNEMKHYLIP